MGLPCYLAMTAGEFSNISQKPPLVAWMACHFSSYETGLTNLPQQLPDKSMLIVNDRTPPHGHDSIKIAEQLKQSIELFSIPYILLDMEEANSDETAKIVSYLSRTLPCKVGVSEQYAKHTEGPVFVSCPPPHKELTKHISKWKAREIWLECVTEEEIAIVTEKGCVFQNSSNTSNETFPFANDMLHCQYKIQKQKERIVFTLKRDLSNIHQLLQDAQGEKISLAVGLYQQFSK